MQACYEFVIGIEAVPSLAARKRCGKPRIYFYAIFLQSVNGKACGSVVPPTGGDIIFRNSSTTPF